jgi:hypothetical protein
VVLELPAVHWGAMFAVWCDLYVRGGGNGILVHGLIGLLERACGLKVLTGDLPRYSWGIALVSVSWAQPLTL